MAEDVIFTPAASEATTPVAEETAPSVEETTEAERIPFEQIQKDYKTDIDSLIESSVKRRLKNTKPAADNWKKAAPLIERAAAKYGIDPSDLDGILKAAEADEDYYQDLALKHGTTPDVERRLEKSAREARTAKEALAEREAADRERAAIDKVQREVEAVREFYPDFNLANEMQNPNFARLANNATVSLLDAYRAVHYEELQKAQAQFVAKAATEAAVNSIQSNRPSEIGMNSGAPASATQDPSKLSKQEIEAIIDRARRGERITFS